MTAYKKEHELDLGKVLERDDLRGVTVQVKLAKARQAARWTLLQQTVGLENQKALAKYRAELTPEDFADAFGSKEGEVPQVTAEALEPMAAYAESVLGATVQAPPEPVLGCDTQEDLVEALLSLGPAESFLLARHVEGLHRLRVGDPL